MNLQPGMIVRTSYGTGPYRIREVVGPCTCPSFIDQINEANPPSSEPHFHLVCDWAGPRVGGRKYECSFLNGYRPDGTSVWSGDRLIFDGLAVGTTGDLFATEAA